MLLHIARDGQKFGPYTPDQVRDYVANGQLLATDLAWFEGAADWMPLHSVPGLSLGPHSSPPPPPPARYSAGPAYQPGGLTHGQTAPMSQGSCACPQCGGGQTMKVSVAHAQGTSTGIFGGLSHAAGQTGTFGGAVVNQTALAKQLSPPAKPGIGCGSVGCLSVFCYWLFMVGVTKSAGWFAFIMAVVGPILVIKLAQQNRAKQMPDYERARDEWERNWVCLQCGRIYTP